MAVTRSQTRAARIQAGIRGTPPIDKTIGDSKDPAKTAATSRPKRTTTKTTKTPIAKKPAKKAGRKATKAATAKKAAAKTGKKTATEVESETTKKPSVDKGKANAAPKTGQKPSVDKGKANAAPKTSQKPSVDKGKANAAPKITKKSSVSKGKANAAPKTAKKPSVNKGKANAAPKTTATSAEDEATQGAVSGQPIDLTGDDEKTSTTQAGEKEIQITREESLELEVHQSVEKHVAIKTERPSTRGSDISPKTNPFASVFIQKSQTSISPESASIDMNKIPWYPSPHNPPRGHTPLSPIKRSTTPIQRSVRSRTRSTITDQGSASSFASLHDYNEANNEFDPVKVGEGPPPWDDPNLSHEVINRLAEKNRMDG